MLLSGRKQTMLYFFPGSLSHFFVSNGCSNGYYFMLGERAEECLTISIRGFLNYLLIFILLLFIGAHKAWVISPPCPTPSLTTHSALPSPLHPRVF
jgi:hypothetical protein